MKYDDISNLYDDIKSELSQGYNQSSSDEHQEICTIMMERYGDEIKASVDDMYESLDENPDDYSERLVEWFNITKWMQASKNG